MPIDLSIVFGTYNRLQYLRDTVAFARASAAPLSVEFVVADGGSTDGTVQWLKAQSDVVYIEHGLHGA